jgi:hypothetical protein
MENHEVIVVYDGSEKDPSIKMSKAIDNYLEENGLRNPSNYSVKVERDDLAGYEKHFVSFIAEPAGVKLTEEAYLLVENLTLLRRINSCTKELLEVDDKDVAEARKILSQIPDIIQRLSDKIQITE